MKGNRVEYYFLKRSIEQFSENLRKIEKIVTNKVFSDDELLDIIHNLVAVKEIIEALEGLYLKKN